MKRLIASDLHGSARFCRQLLERYQQGGAQQLILLGDLVYSGSYAPQYEYDPHQVIQLLRPLAREILWVEGNCDRGAGALGPAFPMYAGSATVSWEGLSVFLTHGHRYGPHNPPPSGPPRSFCPGTPTFPPGSGWEICSAPIPARSLCPGAGPLTAACSMRTGSSAG